MGSSAAQVEIVLAQPRGFCAGVERAVLILNAVVDKYSPHKPVYVLHEIVHNSHVVESFRSKNVTFVNSLHEVPQGAVLVFSAHGVAKQVRFEAQELGLLLVDATCPLVTKVHLEICRYYKSGYQVILIGHKGHREVEGSLGQVPSNVLLVQNADDVRSLEVEDDTKLAYVTQTTLSIDDTRVIIDALKERFPNIVGPDLKDICYATQNRQNAVKQLSEMVDVVLVVGGTNSSNTRRLLELAKVRNPRSFLVGSHEDVDMNWFTGVSKIGVTAGASAPDYVVQELLDYLGSKMKTTVSTMDGVRENIVFKLPELKDA
ncbi:4-hydroxy-3-methylbut-2-enyl diphosphate reductase [Candidatus Anaplasma sp. TIGMIC]|uniref:4-hydroxy-3-methylbut-2-enyl diphosphate reductase n=1 Tax=Candidatus Anaplasma sp. TIGMIC TaxID=3020713 RepID=UPI00232BAFCD|nr:4-hydroxy-3-methylbut-2-enyl diphosphate reductase [Candidatus Anaplasma sp. TIGMIC]MDB1134989.1 4-hydroxy-3-methylbut-2-enyl diphosphate reductase [Candidatus Anaplasma sp. TIGMIC]